MRLRHWGHNARQLVASFEIAEAKASIDVFARAPGGALVVDDTNGVSLRGEWPGSILRSVDGNTWDEVYMSSDNSIEGFAFGFVE